MGTVMCGEAWCPVRREVMYIVVEVCVVKCGIQCGGGSGFVW